MNKEEIYDSQISPLMTQIIAIAQQNGISMIASFAIQHDGEGPDGEDCSQLTCSTVLPDETGEVDERFARAYSVIRTGAQQAARSLMITTDHGDRTKTLTAFI